MLKNDAPWEKAAELTFNLYSSVVHDAGVTRLYYDLERGNSNLTDPTIWSGALYVNALAESQDGVLFTKPLLGQYELAGQDTNIMRNLTLPQRTGNSVWIDPKRSLDGRYVSQSEISCTRSAAPDWPLSDRCGPNGSKLHDTWAGWDLSMGFAVSEDGLNWTNILMPWGGESALNGSRASNPTCPDCGKPVATMADSQTNIIWDARNEEYAMFTRCRFGANHWRAVWRLSTKNFSLVKTTHDDGPFSPLLAGPEQVSMIADKIDNDTHPVSQQSSQPALDYYGASVFVHPTACNGSCYFMFTQRYHHWMGHDQVCPLYPTRSFSASSSR